jgi:hypothetical protein
MHTGSHIPISSLSLASQKLRVLAEEQENIALKPLQQITSLIQELGEWINGLPLEQISVDNEEVKEDLQDELCQTIKDCYKKMDTVMGGALLEKLASQERMEQIYEKRKDIQVRGEDSTVFNDAWLRKYQDKIEANSCGDSAKENIPEWKTWKKFLNDAATNLSSIWADPNTADGVIRFDEQASDEDADILVTHDRTSLICPITQATFIDPVKNISCGHSYSRAAITQLLKNSESRRKNPSIFCPVAGCQVNVSVNTLAPNLLIENLLKRQRQK